jgi:hypothetical protein
MNGTFLVVDPYFAAAAAFPRRTEDRPAPRIEVELGEIQGLPRRI